MKILMLTPEFPRARGPQNGPFILRQVESLQSLGVEIDLLCYEAAQNPINYLKAMRRMREMMAQTKYDLIHAQFGQSAAVALAQRALPVVVTYRGEDIMGMRRPGWKNRIKSAAYVGFSRQSSRFVHGAIVVSNHIGGLLPRNDWTLIPSGVNLSVFKLIPQDEARRQLGWRPDIKYALFAALDLTKPLKRYALAQVAVKLLNQEIPTELKVGTNVTAAEMCVHMNAADALLFCSAQEGSPNVVKESLACNLPVVSVDVGDVRERLTGVEPGGIFDDTPEALAAGLKQVFQKGERSNGRQMVSELSDEAMSRRVIGVYERSITLFRGARTG